MEIQELIKCSIMRGGSSKAVFFLKNDLPKDERLRDKVILRVFGAPDLREIDGLGGADMLTSKVAIIGPSTRKDCDVDYLFGQVSLKEPFIDYSANCGNISSAVGPFAIDEGFVQPTEPMTRIRIHQVNTKIRMIAEVPVKGSKAEVEGTYSIDGVPGTGARISVDFSDSSGANTGRLLTGDAIEVLHVEGEGDFKVSLVDAGASAVFIRAEDLGLKGTESPQEISSNARLLDRIGKIRSYAAQKFGFVDDWRKAKKQAPLKPLVVICSSPANYRSWTTGKEINEQSIDLVCRQLAMGIVHQTFSGTGTISTLAATMIPGTIPNQLARPGVAERGELCIGHPAGIIPAKGRVARENGVFALKEATLYRTARCLMKGYAFIPETTLS